MTAVATAAATYSAPSHAEINLPDAQCSTGPRSVSAKSRVRFNAVKHGMRAKHVILPGESQAEFDERRRMWTINLNPLDEVNEFMVGRAVALSWKLDRLRKAEDARRVAIRLADSDRLAVQAERVVALGASSTPTRSGRFASIPTPPRRPPSLGGSTAPPTRRTPTTRRGSWFVWRRWRSAAPGCWTAGAS